MIDNYLPDARSKFELLLEADSVWWCYLMPVELGILLAAVGGASFLLELVGCFFLIEY